MPRLERDVGFAGKPGRWPRHARRREARQPTRPPCAVRGLWVLPACAGAAVCGACRAVRRVQACVRGRVRACVRAGVRRVQGPTKPPADRRPTNITLLARHDAARRRQADESGARDMARAASSRRGRRPRRLETGPALRPEAERDAARQLFPGLLRHRRDGGLVGRARERVRHFGAVGARPAGGRELAERTRRDAVLHRRAERPRRRRAAHVLVAARGLRRGLFGRARRDAVLDRAVPKRRDAWS